MKLDLPFSNYLYFSGAAKVTVRSLFTDLRDTFTYEFWVKPEVSRLIDKESAAGIAGIRGQRYLIAPGHGGIPAQAGIGVSVGTNGVSVYEHTGGHLPAKLVCEAPIMDWTHVAIVVENKTPSLYLDGLYRKTGLTSSIGTLFASGVFGGILAYGSFVGGLAELRLWDHARTESQIRDNMHRTLKPGVSGLYAYWKMNETGGTVAREYVNGLHGTIAGAHFESPPAIPHHSKIGIVCAGSGYNATRYFAFDLAKSFKRMGHSVEEFDLLQPASLQRLNRILAVRGIDFVLGMNGHSIEHLRERIYSNRMPFPFVAFLVDHPMYHLHRFDFNRSSKQLIVTCFDQTHIAYLNTYFNGVFSKFFIPHGAAVSYQASGKLKKIKERTIDILFAGTYFDPAKYRLQWLADRAYGKLIDDVVEAAIYRYDESITDIAERVFLSRNRPFDYARNPVLKRLLIQADFYIRGRRRREVLEKLATRPIRIYNNDWRYLSARGGNVQVYPAIDYVEFQKRMADAKVVLNILPNIVYGGHDRIFTAMMQGAVSMTDKSVFLEKHFSNGENILMFDHRDPHLADWIGHQLEDADRLQEIADSGYTAANAGHSWDTRAKQILAAVSLYKSRMS